MTTPQEAWLDAQVAAAPVTESNGEYTCHWSNSDGEWAGDPASTEAGARANFRAMLADIIDDCGPTDDVTDFAFDYVDECGVDEQDGSEYLCYIAHDNGVIKSVKKASAAAARAALRALIKAMLDAARALTGPIVGPLYPPPE